MQIPLRSICPGYLQRYIVKTKKNNMDILKRRIIKILIITISLIVILVIAGAHIPRKTITTQICKVTGSRIIDIVYIGLFATQERNKTKLDIWAHSNITEFSNRYKYLHKTTIFFLGKSYACGEAPAIMKFSQSRVEEYFKNLSKVQKENFIEKLVELDEVNKAKLLKKALGYEMKN